MILLEEFLDLLIWIFWEECNIIGILSIIIVNVTTVLFMTLH